MLVCILLVCDTQLNVFTINVNIETYESIDKATKRHKLVLRILNYLAFCLNSKRLRVKFKYYVQKYNKRSLGRYIYLHKFSCCNTYKIFSPSMDCTNTLIKFN